MKRIVVAMMALVAVGASTRASAQENANQQDYKQKLEELVK